MRDDIANVLLGADFGDLRLSLRLARLADAVAGAPGASLPLALANQAALEGAYRFLSNRRVTPEKILEPHIAHTMAQAEARERTLMIHDTTWTYFSGKTGRGLPRTTHGGHGFAAHVTLAVATDGEPLGVTGLETMVRDKPPPSKSKRKSYGYQKHRGQTEHDRWLEQMLAVERRCSQRGKLIHVADRESDKYTLYSTLLKERADFVIRVRKARLVEEGVRLEVAAQRAKTVVQRSVALSARTKAPPGNGTYALRETRRATLSIAAMPTTVLRSWGITVDWPEDLSLNLVRVFEARPPHDAEPVEWLLLTSLPIATTADVEFVVDCYRKRWLIEEFFKAVKTGCGYEKLQLESAQTLFNMLAVVLPIAAQMLRLRYLSRDDTVSATRVLSRDQLDILRALRPELPKTPSAQAALLSVAALGGHIKNNGPPGWLTLYRGFEKLTFAESVWLVRCDQS